MNRIRDTYAARLWVLAARPPGSGPQCPGYWLRPALLWLSASLSGNHRQRSDLLAEAQQLDPVRAAVFLAAGLGLPAGRRRHIRCCPPRWGSRESR